MAKQPTKAVAKEPDAPRSLDPTDLINSLDLDTIDAEILAMEQKLDAFKILRKAKAVASGVLKKKGRPAGQKKTADGQPIASGPVDGLDRRTLALKVLPYLKAAGPSTAQEIAHHTQLELATVEKFLLSWHLCTRGTDQKFRLIEK